MRIYPEVVLEYLILLDLIILGQGYLVNQLFLQMHYAHCHKIECREEGIP